LSNIKVLMQPTHEEVGVNNGVGQVLLNYKRHFPEVGVELVKEGSSYDISVSHLGYDVNADVHHNHGLWIGPLNSNKQDQNQLIVESVRRARRVVVPSNYVAQYFRRDMRIDPAVVGHGVNADEWQGAESKGYALWDKSRKSNICDPHSVNVLARAFRSVPFVTTFAEDSSPRNIHETGLISFDKMRSITLGAHIYIATTKETFGISILQCMAAGIPIIGYNWGGAADIVRSGVDGILVGPGDEPALIDAFDIVMKNRDEFGYNASQRALDFSWLNAVSKLRDLYKSVIEEKNEPVTTSIIIPCYNYAAELQNAVQSACEQTSDTVKEIIIVDDGSTDDTPDVARQLMQHDSRIGYIRQSNGGVASARNTGISHASSKYICCLDADDEIAPGFIDTMVSALEKDKGIRLAYSKITLVFKNGNRSISKWPGEFDANEMLKGHNQVPTCCVFLKEDWQKLGGYKQRYCPKGYGAEDAEFWLRFTKHGYRAKLVTEEPLFIYHLGGGTSKDYKEPDYLSWHTDITTGWLPFSCLGDKDVKAVTEYDQPVYSIIIPVGPGHEIYLEDALDSVEAQSDKRWECVVVFNIRKELLALSDTIDRLIFAYPHVKFIQAMDKRGAGYARNVGVRNSTGEYLVFLDADDYLQPRFLELTRKARERFNLDWVYTDIFTQTEGGVEKFECHEWDIDKLWRHGIMAVTCLYTRNMFMDVGGFDEENNREDWDFHLRLAAHGHCGGRLPLPLFTYRQQLGYRREYRKIATSQEQSRDMKIADVKRLHDAYNLGDLKMACKSCGGNRVDIQDASSSELVTMEYIGRNAGNKNEVTFIGPVTRTRYRTNNGRIINVHPQDAADFVSKSLFKSLAPVKTGSTISTKTPRRAVVETVSWKDQMKAANDFAAEASAEATKAAAEFIERTFNKVAAETVDEEELVEELDGENELNTSEGQKKSYIQSPHEYKVSEILDFVNMGDVSKEELEELYNNEIGGKNRVTILRGILKIIDFDFD